MTTAAPGEGAAVAAQAARDAAQGLELVPQQADAEALAEVYRQGVDSAAASPGPSEYLRDTVLYSLDRLFQWLEGVSGYFSWLGLDLVRVVLTAALALLVGWLLFVLLRNILARRVPAAGDGRLETETPQRQTPTSRDWAEELRLRLEEGDATAALEALWWWLATQLGVPDADPAWTSRELLLHAGRGDLRRPVRRLDHMIYGPEPPATVDVRELWRNLGQHVAGGSS